MAHQKMRMEAVVDPRTRRKKGSSVFVWIALAASIGLLVLMIEMAMWVHGIEEARKWSRRIAGGAVLLIGILLLSALWNDSVRTRRWLEEHVFVDEAKRQSYKCIRPQGPPGQFVVFPVRVLRRGVPNRIIEITNDSLLVELNTDHAAGIDSEATLRSALETLILPKLPGTQVITFQGKDAGPTSLAAGVAIKHAYGASDPLLATKVASALLGTTPDNFGGSTFSSRQCTAQNHATTYNHAGYS